LRSPSTTDGNAITPKNAPTVNPELIVIPGRDDRRCGERDPVERDAAADDHAFARGANSRVLHGREYDSPGRQATSERHLAVVAVAVPRDRMVPVYERPLVS
jgi:hypothetical protein